MWRILILTLVHESDSMFFPLYAVAKPQCFETVSVNSGSSISGSYEISGTGEEVYVSLQHPTTDAPIWSSRLIADHFKHTVATTGQYKLCFRQTSSQARQTASFQIHTQSDYDSYFDGGSNLASKSQTEKLTIISSQIESKVNELMDHQDFAITRESYYRQNVEDTYSSMLVWSVAQIAILLTVSVLQLYYLKRTFDIKLIA